MGLTKIGWTDYSWNIARGCKKVDSDCLFCYMYRDSMNGTRYEPKDIVKTKTVFSLLLKIKEPSKIFVSSLTDWALPEIDSYRHEMWDIIKQCPQHTFQMLTKRPERLLEILPADWSKTGGYKNVWIGTSVGSNNGKQRVRDLINASLRVPIKKIFLSLEPLHGQITFLNDYYFEGMGFDHLFKTERTKMIELIDWVIIGGESGNMNGKYKFRPCNLEWIELIVYKCEKAGVPVFVKQMGTHLAKILQLKDRHGADINEWPKHLRIQKFPSC